MRQLAPEAPRVRSRRVSVRALAVVPPAERPLATRSVGAAGERRVRAARAAAAARAAHHRLLPGAAAARDHRLEHADARARLQRRHAT